MDMYDTCVTQDIMDWFCAIRCAKISLMRELIPELTIEEVHKIFRFCIIVKSLPKVVTCCSISSKSGYYISF